MASRKKNRGGGAAASGEVNVGIAADFSAAQQSADAFLAAFEQRAEATAARIGSLFGQVSQTRLPSVPRGRGSTAPDWHLTAPGTGGLFTGTGGTVQNLGLNLSRGIQDAGMAFGMQGLSGWQRLQMLTMSVGNNVDMIAAGLGDLRKQAADSGQTMIQAFRGGLTSAAGMTLAINGAVAAALVLPTVWASITEEATKAEKAAKAYREEQENARVSAFVKGATSAPVSDAFDVEARRRQLADAEAEAARLAAELVRIEEDLRRRVLSATDDADRYRTNADPLRGSRAAERFVEALREGKAQAQGVYADLVSDYAAFRARLEELRGRDPEKPDGLIDAIRTEVTAFDAEERGRIAAEAYRIQALSQDERETALREHRLRLAQINAEANAKDVEAQRAVIRARGALDSAEYERRIVEAREWLSRVGGLLQSAQEMRAATLREVTLGLTAPFAMTGAGRGLPGAFVGAGAMAGADDVRAYWQQQLEQAQAEQRAAEAATQRAATTSGQRTGARRDWGARLGALRAENARMEAELSSGFQKRRALVDANEDAERAALNRELVEVAKAGEHRAELEAEIQAQLTLVARRAADERAQIDRDEMTQRIERARAVEDEMDTRATSRLDLLGGRLAEERRLENEHAVAVQALWRRIDDEERKDAEEQNAALVKVLRQRIKDEGALYAVRRARLARERVERAALDAASLASSSRSRAVRARAEVARDAAAGAAAMVPGLFGFDRGAGARAGLAAERAMDAADRDAARIAADDERLRRLAAARERFRGEVGAAYKTDEGYRAEVADAEAEHQARLLEIEGEGQRRRLAQEASFAQARTEFYRSSIQDALGTVGALWQTYADRWVSDRAQQLAAMGIAESDARAQAEKEGRGRFEFGKALAIAETTVSTYFAAQKAYESQMAIPTPDAPVRAGIAAALAVGQGLARVAAIQSQTLGGGGAGASSSSGFGVQTFGASPGAGTPFGAPSSSQSIARMGASASQQNAVAQSGAGSREIVAALDAYRAEVRANPPVIRRETEAAVEAAGRTHNRRRTYGSPVVRRAR